jgi:16S rRNA (adenine1518-N6/adenine1519-N6)-dimethyltransferase
MEQVVADSVRSFENGSQRPSFAVEIGPGMGALTRRLLRHIDVHAIEKDIRAVDYLKQHFEQAAPQPHILNVTQGDILRFEPYILAQQASSGTTDPAAPLSPLSPAAAKPLLVGNLPYAISSDFLLWYSRAPDAFTAGHFLLQKEVVDRLVAPVGSKSYGRLGVLMSLYFRTVAHFDVPPEAFEPRPNVTSTFFSLEPLESVGPLAKTDSASAEIMGIFERCTAELFSRRRKMLRKSLEHLFTLFEIPYAECKDAVVTLLGTFGITPEDRPERIPPQGFLALARFLHNHGAKTRQMDSKTEETP